MLSDSLRLAEAAAGKPLKRSEVSNYWSGRARAYIVSDLKSWSHLLLEKTGNFWNAFQYDDLSIIERLRDEAVTLPGIRFGLIAAAALAAMPFLLRSLPTSRWVFAAVILQMLSLLPVFITERYRMAAVPGLVFFAAIGLWWLWEACVSRHILRVATYIALLFTCAYCVSAVPSEPELWALDPYNAGRAALETGDLTLAQQKLEVARAFVPENPEINLALGNLWLERGQTAKAEQFYKSALRVDANHRSALSNLAVVALRQQQPARAADLLRVAMSSGAPEARLHYLLARAEQDLGNRGTAVAEIEAAIRLAPDQAEFVEFRSQLLEPDQTAP
jgi:Tfp pilus assembly protein PilF